MTPKDVILLDSSGGREFNVGGRKVKKKKKKITFQERKESKIL